MAKKDKPSKAKEAVENAGKAKSPQQIMLRIRDISKKIESKPFPISWLITGGDDIEFPATGETLPVKDLAIYFNEYEILLDEQE